MKSEKWLIDANALIHRLCVERDDVEIEHACDIGYHNGLNMAVSMAINAPTVDAVEVEKYNALVEMYHDLRENFIDYVCSGVPNIAPYCLNRCEECVTPHGWCKAMTDKCRGFNPAEVILDGERKDNV